MPFSLTQLRHDLEVLGLRDQVDSGVLVYIAISSRKLDEPIQIIIVGQSSSGKSTLLDTVLQLFPVKEIIKVSCLTRAALVRFKNVRGMVIIIHERLGDSDLEVLFRQLASEREVHYHLCIGGEQQDLTLEGPAVVIENTTDSSAIDFQNRTRSLVVTVDPSPDQLKTRFDAIKDHWTRTRAERDARTADIIGWHREFQSNLKADREVVIPFAGAIGFRSPHPHSQRLFSNFIRLVAAIAFLNQNNREEHRTKYGSVYIEATPEDYEAAYQIVQAVPIETGTDVLPEESTKLFADLKANARFTSPTTFTRLDISQTLKQWTPKRVRTWIDPLVEYDLLYWAKGKQNRKEYVLTPQGKALSPKRVFRNCFTTLTPPEEVRRLSSLPERALEGGQTQRV